MTFFLLGLKILLWPQEMWQRRVFVSVACRILAPVAYIGGGAQFSLFMATHGPYKDVHSRRQLFGILTSAFRVGGGLAVGLLLSPNGLMTREQFGEFLNDPLSRARSSIHPAPGWRLHRLAAWIFSRRTFEEILEPVLSDLQEEFFEALSQGARRKAQWVRVRGYCNFWINVVLMVPVTVTRTLVALWKMFW